MADYFKLRLIGTYSTNSDYSDPIAEFDWSVDETPNEVVVRKVEAVTGGGTAISVTDLDNPLLYIMVKNRDTTNYVELDYTEGAAGAATPTIRILAGQCAVITDIDASSAITLTANTAAVDCDVVIVAS